MPPAARAPEAAGFPHILHHLDALLAQYGSGLVGLVVALEATGLPLPGESLLIAAALYSATTHRIPIGSVLAAASIGAIVGDNIGFLIGRSLGLRLLSRYGRRLGLSEDRLLLGRYLFARYGGPVVFAARFVAVLRTLAALLAGANRMGWGRFTFWNALGGIAWACGYGMAAYLAGDAIHRIAGPVGIALAAVAITVATLFFLFLRKNERRLIEEARAAARSGRPSRSRSRAPG